MTASQAALLMTQRDPYRTLCGKPRQFVYGIVGEDGFEPHPPPLSRDPYDMEAIRQAMEAAHGCD